MTNEKMLGWLTGLSRILDFVGAESYRSVLAHHPPHLPFAPVVKRAPSSEKRTKGDEEWSRYEMKITGFVLNS